MVGELSDTDAAAIDLLVERRLPLARGQQLPVNSGAGHDRLYTLRQGAIKILRGTDGGGQYIDSLLSEGAPFSLEPAECGTTPASAEALCPSEICEFSLVRLCAAARCSSTIAQMLLNMQHQRLLREQALARMLRCANAEQRLAGALLYLSGACATPDAAPQRLAWPVSRQEIGEHLGLSGATISRLLVRLQRQGAIMLDQRAIVVRDLQQLRSLSGRDPAPAAAQRAGPEAHSSPAGR